MLYEVITEALRDLAQMLLGERQAVRVTRRVAPLDAVLAGHRQNQGLEQRVDVVHRAPAHQGESYNFV